MNTVSDKYRLGNLVRIDSPPEHSRDYFENMLMREYVDGKFLEDILAQFKDDILCLTNRLYSSLNDICMSCE